MDIAFADATDYSGSVGEGSGNVTFLVIKDSAYFKVDTNLMKLAQVNPPDCGAVCGKYVLVPPSTSSQFIGSLSLSGLINQMVNGVPSPADPGATNLFVRTTFNGQPALKATFAGGTVEVAASGPAYPLAVSDPQGDHLTFSEWNSVSPLSPPPASEVVSMTSL